MKEPPQFPLRLVEGTPADQTPQDQSDNPFSSAWSPQYFSASDIGEIAKKLMGLIPLSIKLDQGVRATYALRALQLLKKRVHSFTPPMHLVDLSLAEKGSLDPTTDLGALTLSGEESSSHLRCLNLLYGNTVPCIARDGEYLGPKPIAQLIRDYTQGNIKKEDVSAILEDAYKQVIRYFCSNKIRFGDPDELPKRVSVGEQLKTHLQDIIRQEKLSDNVENLSSGIWGRASKRCHGLGVDVDYMAEDLASAISARDYSNLTLRIGIRDPTPQELAGHYVSSLQKAFAFLSVGPPPDFDPVKAVQSRLEDKIAYQKDLAAYKEKMGSMFLLKDTSITL